MVFNGKGITRELFTMEDDRLSQVDLQDYAYRIGEELGVRFIFMVKT